MSSILQEFADKNGIIFDYDSTIAAVPGDWPRARRACREYLADLLPELKLPQSARVDEMEEIGVKIFRREKSHNKKLSKKIFDRIVATNALQRHQKNLLDFNPSLVCISQGSILGGIMWMEWCKKNGIKYIVVTQANAERWWPDDTLADKLINGFSFAQKSLFVSKGNLELLERQLGAKIPKTQIIWNPVQASCEQPMPWPDYQDGIFRMACVGRLDPLSKGQDLFIKVMSQEKWKKRPIVVSLYGSGPSDRTLRRLVQTYGLQDKVVFCGHISRIQNIWNENHILLLTSRYEGMPLALLEAMLLGRPSIITDVAGNAEVVDHIETGFVAEAPTVNLVDKAIEQAWEKRNDWKKMGLAASASIRKRITVAPVEQFADIVEKEL